MKKISIILLTICATLLVFILGGIIFISSSLKSVSNSDKEITFTISQGKNSKTIINDLKTAGLIRNSFVAQLYLKTHSDIVFQAGDYILKQNMSTPEIFEILQNGKVFGESIRIQFIPGVSIKKYIEQIAKAYNWDSNELINKINDKEYLKTLISKYWFLDETILSEDLYYALEGYLIPETYDFYKDASFEDIIDKMLKHTDKLLSKYKDEIKNSQYAIHDLLTVASIAEKEALDNKNDRVNGDRNKVAQVVYTRLNKNMSLGMDVTTYYGVQKDMKEPLTKADLNNNNPYNTRLITFIGLPAGPICNVSESSIIAALRPSDTDYIYFFADITTGKVYFTNDYKEFLTFKEIYG